MWRAKGRDRAHPAHPLVPRQGLACQGPATACQGRQAFPKRRGAPLTGRRVDHAVPWRPPAERLHTGRGAVDQAPCGRAPAPSLIALDDWREANVAPRTQPGPSPPVPGRTGSRKASRRARMEDPTPSVQTRRGRRAAPRRPRAVSRRFRDRSRGARTAPPSHPRVFTLRASAIQTPPRCFLPRRSSAGPWPRARGGSPTYAGTAGPCRPDRAHQAAPGRASQPQAATSAGRGQPWARRGTTRLTVSAAGRRRYNTVPVVALNVLWPAGQRKRGSCCEWRRLWPAPLWPLAGHARWGQKTVVGSRSVLLTLLGSGARGVCLAPRFLYK